MPSYTLKCRECNYTKDYIVQIRDGVEDKHYCPICFANLKGVVLERDFNPPKNLVVRGGKNRYTHTDDKKIKSDFEQHMNDVRYENQTELDKEKDE